MARAGGMRHWAALKRTLAIPANTDLKPLPKPTDEILDGYESATGLRLPHSYRAFIKVFGPGTLAWDYVIVAPGYTDQRWTVDLAAFNAVPHATLKDKRVLRQFKDPAQVQRLVFFCRPGDGDLVGWDPEERSGQTQARVRYLRVGEGRCPRLRSRVVHRVYRGCMP